MEKRDVLIIILYVLVIILLAFSIYSHLTNAKKIAENNGRFVTLAEADSFQWGQQHKANKVFASELKIDINKRINELEDTA